MDPNPSLLFRRIPVLERHHRFTALKAGRPPVDPHRPKPTAVGSLLRDRRHLTDALEADRAQPFPFRSLPPSQKSTLTAAGSPPAASSPPTAIIEFFPIILEPEHQLNPTALMAAVLAPAQPTSMSSSLLRRRQQQHHRHRRPLELPPGVDDAWNHCRSSPIPSLA